MTRSRRRSAPYSGESCSRVITPWAMLWSCRSATSDVLSSRRRTVHCLPDEELLEGQDLPPIAQGVLGQEPDLGERVDDDPASG